MLIRNPTCRTLFLPNAYVEQLRNGKESLHQILGFFFWYSWLSHWFPFTVFVDCPLEADISSIFLLLNSHLQAERGELFVLCPTSAGDGSRRKHTRR